jgi:4-hydroxyphenylacetate 3-monooxygenase
MTVKDGKQHLAAIDKDREVFLNGTMVRRVVNHPAFANSCQSTAAMYDFQAAPENHELMTFETPTGRRVNRSWMQPTCYEDLVAKRKAMTAWAELHGGFMGRSPDHLACAIAGQVMGIEVFEKHGSKYAKAYRDYYEYARDNDIFLTYVIINPQADRSKAWGEQASENLTAHIVDEDSTGITIRGAKMLGTSSIMAEEVFVANLQPLQPGEEDLAVSFAIPLEAKGIKILSRKSYEESAVSPWDNPLSHRFDENDALIYFDDVKVPWERVFVYRDTDMCRAQFHDTPGHISQNYQAQVRWVVKMKFLLAIARRITETIGTIKLPPVAEKLGQMSAQVAVAEGLLYGMEASGTQYGDFFVPNKNLVYTAQVYTQDIYPKFVNEIRELAGGGLIMLPSSAADLGLAEIAPYLAATQVSSREGEDAYDRMKLMKLAWDAVGSEFASRHTQYEMFYAGAQFVTAGHSFRTYDWGGADDILSRVMDGNDVAWTGSETGTD